MVLNRLTSQWRNRGVLHVAPEAPIIADLRDAAAPYVTVDLAQQDVDVRADLTRLPFPDSAFGLVFASHVLEHIDRDHAAIAEVFRVLEDGGIALLSVPVKGETTIEYDAPRESEHGHVRQPGRDYFDRYRSAGFQVRLISSADFDADRLQLRVHRPNGEVVDDQVPVCEKPGGHPEPASARG